MSELRQATTPEALDALAEERGYGGEGIEYLPLSDKLTVGILIVDIQYIVAMRLIPNELLAMAQEDPAKIAGYLQKAEHLPEALDFLDKLCGAVIKDPPYVTRENLVNGRAPRGHLTMFIMDTEEKANVFRIIYGGLEKYKSFLSERDERSSTAPNVQGLREEPSGLSETSETLAPVLDRRSNIGDLLPVGVETTGENEERTE
jgi:hypothetical protein